MRAITSLLTLALLSVLIGSCSEDITTPTQQQDDKQIRTYFISGSTDDDDPSNAPGIGGASKIKVNYDRLFFWQPGDHIWMYYNDGPSTPQWVQDASSNVAEGKRGADFGFTQECTQNTYKVRYTGLANDKTANGQKVDKVVISANQTQDAPNVSDHIAYDGDCAVATATRIADENKFEFKLDHKAHILVFTPRVDLDRDPEMCYIKQIKITELDGKPLAGTYAFGDDGLDIPNVSNASSVVTFTPKTPGIFQLKKVKSVNDNACYVVIQPGQHRLKIEYTLGFGETWAPVWSGSSYSYTYTETPAKTYTKYLPAGVNGSNSDSNTEPATGQVYECKENDITRITHKLPFDGENVEFSFEIPFAYYQWDARGWLFYYNSTEKWGWTGEKNFEKGLGSVSRTTGVSDFYAGYGYSGQPNKYDNSSYVWYNSSQVYSHIDRWRSYRYGTDQGMWSCADKYNSTSDVEKRNVFVPNANAMTWYIMNGDVYYDANTAWALKDFRGGEAVFRDGKAIFKGGLWIKKRDKITGFNTEESTESEDLRATFPTTVQSGADTNPYRTNPTIGKPSDDVIDDYFFLPLLGYFDVTRHGSSATTGTAIYNFLGARARYWTSTPYLQTSSTSSHQRAAYYLSYDAAYNVLTLRAEPDNRYQGYVANRRPEHWWNEADQDAQQWFQ